MKLFPALEKRYTREPLTAREAQRAAQFIAFGPIVFQVSRLMVKFGILDLLREHDEGLTLEEIAEKTALSAYAARVLLEASLSIGTVLVDTKSDRFTLSKTGWFLLTDASTRVNLDFNQDVNYEGWFRLEESLKEGRPAGLEHFGAWPTVYEGLSQLPPQVQKSWFAFDHFYSDHSFDEALQVIFSRPPLRLLDVGGNTGRWALRCVAYDPQVEVTIMDLPQQLELMRQQTASKTGSERIHGYGCNLLDEATPFPTDHPYDAIWMSQFLDCFSPEEAVSILQRCKPLLSERGRFAVLECLVDGQKFPAAGFSLAAVSLYFTTMANGNSRFYRRNDLLSVFKNAGLDVEYCRDNVGVSHTLYILKPTAAK